MNVGKLKKWLLTFVILFVVFNCEYDFSEDSFTEVEQVAPSASLSLNSIRDNQEFYVTTTITFSYNGNNKHLLYEVRVYIDDQLIETSSSSQGSFIIDTESLSDGNHKLKVEYIFSSGSGSLADISGLEAFIKTDEYNFVVDKSIPETVVMKSAEIIDGTIYISWEPITKMNFDKATLIISNNGNKTYNEITKQELLKLTYNDIYVHKSTCQGQTQNDNNLEYYISLENTRGNSVSNILNLYIPPFEVEKLIVDDNHFKIIIPQHALFKNFDYYLFRDSTNKTYKVSSSGGEIIVEEPIKFPSFNAGVLLNFYKESSGEDISRGCSFSPTSFEKEFDYDPSSSYGEFLYNQFDNLIYVLRTGSSRVAGTYIMIEKLDSETLESLDINLVASKYNGYARDLTITSTGNLIIDANDTSYLLDGQSLSIINEWTLADFGMEVGNIKYRNNTISIEQDNQISIYDSSTKELIFNISKSGYFKISDSGRYFYVNNAIFEINNGTISKILDINTNNDVNLVEFIENQNKCVYNVYDSSPIMVDLTTGGSRSLSDFTRINIMSYDKKANKLLFVRSEFGLGNTQPSYTYVYNLETSSFKSIEVRNVVSIWQPNIIQGYWFQNNKLIYGSGLGFYLDHYINE